jgi:WS/DGAT/MGAT family acyltransferase
MPHYSYERLSAQDNMFLLMERPEVHMHVAATLIYEAGPLRTEEGGIDVRRIKRATEAVLHLIPRYRQKLEWIPLLNHPVWVDDPRFELDYHIRHRALPKPGSRQQLQELAAHIMSKPLDRTKPLWEMWVVEGLEGDRFAVISKVHHCMIDGSSGVDLAHILLSTSPEREIAEAPAYVPRPEPGGATLLLDEVKRTLSLPLHATHGLREFAAEADDLRRELEIRARALSEILGWAVQSPSQTPINGPQSPHRRFDWLTTPLARVKAVRRALDCTLNDVVLTTVTGAVRDYLEHRRVDPASLEFRVSAPVSVRRADERGKLGNRVSSWIVKLPIGESEPTAQLREIHRVTAALKKSQQALGVDMIMKAANWAPSGLVSLGAQASSGPINSIVTNVPGPQFPLYMQGSRLLEMYPQVPLLANMGLGIALFSYDGRLCWGFNADRDLVPDLSVFRTAVEAAFERLCGLADVGTHGPGKSKPEANATTPRRRRAPRPSSASEPSTPARTRRQ